METIYLAVADYKNTKRISLQFSNITAINNCVRKVAGVRWSKTLKAWHMPYGQAAVSLLAKQIKSLAQLNTEVLKEQLLAIKYERERAYYGRGLPTQPISPKNINNASATAAVRKPLTAPVRMPATTTAAPLSLQNTAALHNLVNNLKLKAYSESTIRTYKNEFGVFLQTIKQKPAESITVDDLRRYMLYCLGPLKLTENTVHSRLNALKFYYEQVLGREKFFFEIPRPKKPIKLPKVISEEKVLEALFAVVNLKHKTILLLAYSAGLRVSEVVNIKPEDINSDRMQIFISRAKGKKDRMVTLSAHLLPLLREYYIKYRPKIWLFEGQYGENYGERSAQMLFHQAFKKLNLPAQFSFHSLRHSYATHLLDNGTDISYIQKLLGHNDIKTTLRYTQVSTKDVGKIESPLDKAIRKKGG